MVLVADHRLLEVVAYRINTSAIYADRENNSGLAHRFQGDIAILHTGENSGCKGVF